MFLNGKAIFAVIELQIILAAIQQGKSFYFYFDFIIDFIY